jgi:hypothetical protein
MQSASLLLRAAGKRSGACIPRLAAPQITSSGAASTGHQISASHAGCVTQHGLLQLRAVLTGCTASSAACSVVRSQSTAAAAAIGLQAAGASAAAAAARSAPTGTWVAGAALHIGAAVRPASETLKRELQAVIQPENVMQRAQRACRTSSNAAGGAPLGSALLHGTNTAALPAAGPQSAAAAKHLVRLPQPRPASSSSSAAAAGHACRQQSRGGVTSSRVPSPAAGLAERQGAGAAGVAAHQSARAYNGYSRASYQSPYASVSLSRGMNPMHALYGVIGAHHDSRTVFDADLSVTSGGACVKCHVGTASIWLRGASAVCRAECGSVPAVAAQPAVCCPQLSGVAAAHPRRPHLHAAHLRYDAADAWHVEHCAQC